MSRAGDHRGESLPATDQQAGPQWRHRGRQEPRPCQVLSGRPEGTLFAPKRQRSPPGSACVDPNQADGFSKLPSPSALDRSSKQAPSEKNSQPHACAGIFVRDQSIQVTGTQTVKLRASVSSKQQQQQQQQQQQTGEKQ